MFKVRWEEEKIGFLRVLFVFRSCARFISFYLFIRTREPVGYKIDLDSVNDDNE